jgi:hypothetical protein
MTTITRTIVYPDGDEQEISHDLRVNQIVDLNGAPLSFPLQTPRIIAYRVMGKRTTLGPGAEDVYYSLSLLTRPELESLMKHGG